MCDKGMLEIDNTLAKLEYCIAVHKDVQDKIVETIGKLIGKEVIISSPLPGNFPKDNTYLNQIEVNLKEETTSKVDPKWKWRERVCLFSLTQLPGCCGILVSHNTFVDMPYRGKGIAKFLQKIKEEIAKDNQFTMLMCTTRKDNKVQNKLLKKSGWQKINKFKNKRTRNNLFVWVKEL